MEVYFRKGWCKGVSFIDHRRACLEMEVSGGNEHGVHIHIGGLVEVASST